MWAGDISLHASGEKSFVDHSNTTYLLLKWENRIGCSRWNCGTVWGVAEKYVRAVIWFQALFTRSRCKNFFFLFSAVVDSSLPFLSACHFLLRSFQKRFHSKYRESPAFCLGCWGPDSLSSVPLLQHKGFLHENVAVKHVNLNSTPSRRRRAENSHITTTTHIHHQNPPPHTHTHWGGAAGRRSDWSCPCSVHTAGWWPPGLVRRHERKPPSLGSEAAL